MTTLSLRTGATRPAASLPTPTRTMRRLGLGASTLAVLFLLADATAQLLAAPPVIAAAAHIGFPATAALWQAIGAVLLLATLLYAIPRTAFLGAVLVTGYLGGAICAHVRMGEGLLAPTVISLVVAAFVWSGLALRDARVRSLLTGA